MPQRQPRIGGVGARGGEDWGGGEMDSPRKETSAQIKDQSSKIRFMARCKKKELR